MFNKDNLNKIKNNNTIVKLSSNLLDSIKSAKQSCIFKINLESTREVRAEFLKTALPSLSMIAVMSSIAAYNGSVQNYSFTQLYLYMSSIAVYVGTKRLIANNNLEKSNIAVGSNTK